MMDFYEMLDQVVDLLQRRGRLSYRALKVQFSLDDDALGALKEELIEIHQGSHRPGWQDAGVDRRRWGNATISYVSSASAAV